MYAAKVGHRMIPQNVHMSRILQQVYGTLAQHLRNSFQSGINSWTVGVSAEVNLGVVTGVALAIFVVGMVLGGTHLNVKP